MMVLELKTGIPQKWHNCQVAAYAHLVKENWLIKEFKIIPGFKRIDTKESHEYYLKKVKILSVSDICMELQPWSYKGETAMRIGKWIHEYCHLIDEGCAPDIVLLGENQEDIKPTAKKTEAYKRFKADYQLEDKEIINETPLYSSLGYAGTFDKFVPGPGELQVKILYLKETGDYSIIHLNENELDRYFNFFCHSLEMLKHKKVVDKFKEPK